MPASRWLATEQKKVYVPGSSSTSSAARLVMAVGLDSRTPLPSTETS